MEKIRAKMTVEMTAESVTYINSLIERDEAKEGIPHDTYRNLNKCPVCGESFGEVDSFCERCGQRLKFNKSDIIPL